MIVLKLFSFNEADSLAGQYLESADVDADNGYGSLELTSDLEKAMKFPSTLDALQFWRRQSSVRPLRPDGKPNRPLTAFHAMIEKVQDDRDR